MSLSHSNIRQKPWGGHMQSDQELSDGKQWTRHPDLYMPDGSLVLLAEDTLFRVYGGLLSKHSEIFSDMLSLSGHQPPDAETYEGASLVRLPDTSEDLGHFLNACIDINYFPGPGNDRLISFRAVSAILRLATKYMVPALRERAISHINCITPVEFEDVSLYITYKEVFGETPWPRAFKLVPLLRECNVDKLLPWAYYRVCRSGVDSILSLPPKDLDIALRGWKALRDLDTRITLKLFAAPGQGCRKEACNDSSRLELVRWNVDTRVDSLRVLEGKRRIRGVCSKCAVYFRKVEEEETRKVWRELPGYFDLPPWEELRLKE